MSRPLSLCLLAFVSCSSCKGFVIEVPHPVPRAPHPAPHPAPAPGPGESDPHCPPPKYGHLPQRQSFTTMASLQLKEGCYLGDFVLGRVQLRVKGAGVGKTVIHGNLVVQTQCTVSNLTVDGDVIFEGNQGELVDVDYLGRIVDKGVQNRY